MVYIEADGIRREEVNGIGGSQSLFVPGVPDLTGIHTRVEVPVW